jgi:hypothetical protein
MKFRGSEQRWPLQAARASRAQAALQSATKCHGVRAERREDDQTRPCEAQPQTIWHYPLRVVSAKPTQGSTKLPVARAPEARTVGVMAKPSPRAATPRLSRTERRPLHVSKRLLLSDNRSASKDLCEPTSKKGDRARWPVHLDTPLERSGRERDFAVNRRIEKGVKPAPIAA